jgi:hypothetical protein
MSADAPRADRSARMLCRARLMSSASDTDSSYWQEFYHLAKIMGELIHAARQCMELGPSQIPETLVGEDVLWLWESGLMLPEEVTKGDVTRLVRWLIDRLRKQRDLKGVQHLAHDAFALLTELEETDPAFDPRLSG